MATVMPGGLAVDMPSLDGALPDCPPTVWNSDGMDIAAEQAKLREADLAACPLEILATPEDNAKGLAYFSERAGEFRELLKEHGTIWFKGFDLMKDEKGFRAFYDAVGLSPCLDPIHTSGLRAFASAQDAVYEEVNKQSLSQHYIGLHNEATKKKSAMYGAFVCFKPATVKGGEFFIADGAKIFRDLDTKVLEKLYNSKVRISVSNLDFDFLNALGPLKPGLMDFFRSAVDALIAPKFDMDLEMTYGADGKEMRLQAIEGKQSPVNRHPETGLPVWFCNVHNHARYLRDRRPCTVPEVGMTDVYLGDLSHLEPADLDHINEVSERNIESCAMQAGDVLLVDNYRVLHGRDTFEGDRYHAVSWFDGWKADGKSVVTDGGKPGNMLNKMINSLIK
mmetsp:Transcript_6112/g.15040  ORF Transcript_6112/g.15040 Transcript_6112/m.15040 type:complete len:393 (-) Transcript_6112:382-1560(-)